MVQVVVTAAATLVSVLLGGWIATRSQYRLSRQQEEREWRDRRLDWHQAFLESWREYIAYALLPEAEITVTRRAREPYDLMPQFVSAEGLERKARFEGFKTDLRLVANGSELVSVSRLMVRCARQLAVERVRVGSVADMSPAVFDACWGAERAFVQVARAEVGLAPLDFGAGAVGAPSPGLDFE